MPLPSAAASFLLARLGDTQIGLATDTVQEIVRAVSIAPMLGAPIIFEGAINLHGQIVPVVDARLRFGLAPRALSPDQFFVILRAGERTIAVRVDDVDDVVDIEEAAIEAPESVSPVLRRLSGVAAMASGALVLYDADAFLTQAEHDALIAVESEQR